MGFPILVRLHLYIELGPRTLVGTMLVTILLMISVRFDRLSWISNNLWWRDDANTNWSNCRLIIRHLHWFCKCVINVDTSQSFNFRKDVSLDYQFFSIHVLILSLTNWNCFLGGCFSFFKRVETWKRVVVQLNLVRSYVNLEIYFVYLTVIISHKVNLTTFHNFVTRYESGYGCKIDL